MRNIASPFSGFGSPFRINLRNSVAAIDTLLMALSTDATQLVAHPLEYGSMFQDRAGSIPVTAPGQLVGLALDWGLTGKKPVLGPELVTNGGFDSATGWSATRALIAGGVASFADNTLGASEVSRTDVTTVSGKTYEVTFTASAASSGLFFCVLGLTYYTIIVFAGENRFKLVAGSTPGDFRLRANTANVYTGTIDNISVRELPGYHATAVSDAARGIFREEGGKRWIEYNGINTAYQTPVLPSPGVDKVQVFAGVRKLSDAVVGIPISSGSTSSGSVEIYAPSSGGTNSYRFVCRGAAAAGNAITAGYAAPLTNVLTGLGDISGDRATLRIDGTQVVQSTADQGAGNFNPAGTHPIFYGARAGASQFLNGNHYATLGPIVRFSAANATPEQIAAAEAYYTRETGL